MLTNNIQQDMIAAMKATEPLKVSVLRMLLSEINYKNIDLGRELTDDDVIGVIRKEVKKRTEAVESYTAGGRAEQAAQEKAEQAILELYLPALMTKEQIREEVDKQWLNIPEGDQSDFGKVMRLISPLFKGKADGSMVAKIVKEKISV